MHKKYSALILTVVILAGGAYYTQQYFIESSANHSVVVATTTGAHAAPTAQVAPIITPSSTDAPKTVSPSSTISTPNVTISVGNTTYQVYAPEHSTVLDAMKTLASTGTFAFTARYFPGLGAFIESINGKKNADGYYWILYVNGTSSNTGASETHLKEGDFVEWKYEKSY